jgi:hypothetical protein
MIGFITGVARTALTQVARQFGREAMERIMAGEAIESVLTRDQLRELAKKTGRVAFNELMKQGKDAIIKDYEKKNTDWNARMNDFTRNLDDEFRKNTTLYKEETSKTKTRLKIGEDYGMLMTVLMGYIKLVLHYILLGLVARMVH